MMRCHLLTVKELPSGSSFTVRIHLKDPYRY